jgi:hypothetical protein
MSTIPPGFCHALPPFPVDHYWEELRRNWENRPETEIPAQNVQDRNAALKTAATVSGIPLDQGLIIEIDDLMSVVAPLALTDDEPLIQALLAVAGRFLLPRHREYFQSSARETKAKLRLLIDAAENLERLLEETTGEVAQVIEAAHNALQTRLGRNGTLRLHRLSMSLTMLSQALFWVERSIEIPARRSTSSTVRRKQALVDAAGAIEGATERRIVTGWAKTGTPQKDEFKGADGAVLLAFMRLLEPKASEATLVKAFRNSQIKPG